MSTAYGTDLGISATNLLIILFVTQIVACPFALLYGKLSETFTGKNAICRYYYLHHYLHICLFLKNDTRFLDFSNVSCYFQERDFKSLVGVTTQFAGVLSIIVLFIIGGFLLTKVLKIIHPLHHLIRKLKRYKKRSSSCKKRIFLSITSYN